MTAERTPHHHAEAALLEPRAAAPSFVADDAWVEVLRLGGDTPSGVPRAGDGCWFIVAAGSGVYVSVGRSSLRARTRNELAVQLGITHAVKRSASRRFGAYAVEAATPLCAAARARGFTSIQLWDEACTARSSPAACWLEIVSCHDACMAERRDEPDKTRRDSCADGLPLRTGLNATQPCMCEPGDVIVHARNVIHGSFENKSRMRRATYYLGYLPHEAVVTCKHDAQAIRRNQARIPLCVAARTASGQHATEAPFEYAPAEAGGLRDVLALGERVLLDQRVTPLLGV